MCGICGIYDPSGTVDESNLRRMTDLMRYRGPDRDGFHVDRHAGIGYRRLSIIDLVTGDQPIANEDETMWIVYNGEIYNYLTLRGRLETAGHRFRTNADTEVLVHGYEEWGVEVLGQINGMFAFALWDATAGRLFAARDRLGVKPLYYAERNGALWLASEAKCLVAGRRVRLNFEALADYLAFQNCFGPKTFFVGVKKLLPAQYLLAKDDKVVVHDYWDLDVSRPTLDDESAAKAKYLDLLEDSVRLELMSDVPLGCQLSGGLDSTSVVVAAAKHLRGFDTFTAAFPEADTDEAPYARVVAEQVGAKEHEVRVRPEDVPKILPRILYQIDEPRGGYGVIPEFQVADLASRHVRVMLTGHGGDELFAGYPSYLYAHLRGVPRGGRALRELGDSLAALPMRLREEGAKRVLGLPVYSIVQGDLRRYGRQSVFPREAFASIVADGHRRLGGYDPRAHLEATLKKCAAKDLLSRLMYLDVKTYLPCLLDNADRTSMAFSVESRVPILDHRMAEFSGSVDPSLKVRGLTLKYLPRAALRGYVPAEILDRKKMGFPVPLGEWFRDGLANWVGDVLSESRLRETGILNPACSELVDRHVSGKHDLTNELWTLVNVELWARTYHPAL